MATFAIDLISGRVFLFVPDIGSGTGDTGTTSGSTYPEVDVYSNLPSPASAYNGETYLVQQPEGDYVLNRKEAGLYFSNGLTWYRLGDTPSFFKSDNFQVYDSVDTTKGIEFVTSGITGGTFRQYTWQDQDGTVALLTDIDGKVDESIFNFYTGTTAPATYLTISNFGVYSATTEVRLTGIEADITGNTQLIYELSGKTKHYDGIDTQANILALPASAYTGQLWYAIDTKMEYQPYSISTTGTDEWVGLHIIYDPVTDTYKLPTTVDGQTQNLGQEIFINAHNESTTGATELNPKVFITTGVHVGLNNEFSKALLTISSDISNGSTYGINTTDAGVGEYFKITTYGLISDINTSAWTVNTTLYVSDTVAGEITDVKPTNNPIIVGVVKEQNATTGKIFVNTIRQVSEEDFGVPLNFTYNYFTADPVTGITGSNYFMLPNDKGTVASLTLSQTVNDDTRADLPSQFLSPVVSGSPVTFQSGIYDGQILFEVDNSTANEKIYVEVYHADSGGTVIDSGISGMSTGFSYPVRPLAVLTSALLELDVNTQTSVYVSGKLLENVTLNVGERYRVAISVEKVGTLGGVKQFTGYFGTDYDSFLRTPYVPALGQLADVNTDGATQNSVIKYNSASAIWVASEIQISDVNNLQTVLDTISGETATKQDRIIPLQLKDISGGTEVNTIVNTPIVWTTQEYSGTSLNFTGGSRIYIQESTDFTISYVLNVENQTNTRKNIGALIRKNGNIDITPMSSSSTSIDKTNDSLTNTMSAYKVALLSGDYIELIAFRIGNTGSALTVPDGSWIKIEKI